ncbi:MAG: ATP-grasp domain-containing protein [Deltaproteobacteria bacterium]|nr:MAG: ATP-grasp domain-containing protein [Deltaproteobacteria bacterium]
MHVVLVEPRFPANQRQFVRALKEVGATVTAIGEGSKGSLDAELRHLLTHYEEVANVCSERAMLAAVARIQRHAGIDRLEATVEAHMMTAAKVRERAGIPGTSVRTTWLCRDKPAMKEALREGGIPCAASTGADDGDAVRAFAERVGYPLIVKPRDGAGASGTFRVDGAAELERAIALSGVDRPGVSVAVEEFIEGHEGFWDTLTCRGEVVHEFACHYYPNVLEAMRTRWISPCFIQTNRIDAADGYTELKAMGRKVIEVLGIETSATHMEWFFGPKGLRFSEIGCRPPGVRAWDLYNVGNDMDLYREWAMLLVHGRPSQQASRRLATGIIALRPECDGRIVGYEGLDAVRHHFGHCLIDWHLPTPGTRTQPVEAGYMANAWVRLKHPDYDALRRIMTAVGEMTRVRARP